MLYCGVDCGHGDCCSEENGACGQCVIKNSLSYCGRERMKTGKNSLLCCIEHGQCGDCYKEIEVLNKPDKPLSEEAQIRKDRGEKYGDFALGMEAFTMCIEAMVMQATQKRVKLPKYFGALVMCSLKDLREVFQHDPDNGKDHFNYLEVAREMGYEK